MNWYRHANSNISIEHQVLDEEGQTHPRGIVSAYDRSIRQEVGNLLYSIYNDKLDIDNVEVVPNYRRQGLATKMIQFLLAEYPELTLMPQIVSNDGAHLFRNLREKKIVSRTKERGILIADAGGNPSTPTSNAWETTRKDYYNNGYIGGEAVNIQITDDISDYQTLDEILPTLNDGYYVVSDHIVQVQNKQGKTLPDLHAEYDYRQNRYNVIRRPSQERPIFFHGTRGQVSRVNDLKPGGDYGPLGPNQYRAIYITQDPRDAHSYKWGEKGQVLSLRLKPEARIATHQEAVASRRKHPEMSREDAIRAEGFVGVGMKNRRGDYVEIALFDASAIEEHDPHRDEVARALSQGLSVPESVMSDYGDLRPTPQKTAASFPASFQVKYMNWYNTFLRKITSQYTTIRNVIQNGYGGWLAPDGTLHDVADEGHEGFVEEEKKKGRWKPMSDSLYSRLSYGPAFESGYVRLVYPRIDYSKNLRFSVETPKFITSAQLAFIQRIIGDMNRLARSDERVTGKATVAVDRHGGPGLHGYEADTNTALSFLRSISQNQSTEDQTLENTEPLIKQPVQVSKNPIMTSKVLQ